MKTSFGKEFVNVLVDLVRCFLIHPVWSSVDVFNFTLSAIFTRGFGYISASTILTDSILEEFVKWQSINRLCDSVLWLGSYHYHYLSPYLLNHLFCEYNILTSDDDIILLPLFSNAQTDSLTPQRHKVPHILLIRIKECQKRIPKDGMRKSEINISAVSQYGG